jgi:hypothetical protein
LRKQLVLDEANAIATTALRARLLPQWLSPRCAALNGSSRTCAVCRLSAPRPVPTLNPLFAYQETSVLRSYSSKAPKFTLHTPAIILFGASKSLPARLPAPGR